MEATTTAAVAAPGIADELLALIGTAIPVVHDPPAEPRVERQTMLDG
jgi:hypothetical protein